MSRNVLLGLGLVFGLWCVPAASASASEFTDSGAEAAATLLTEHIEGKPGGMVVGLVDAEGSKVVGAGTLDDGTGRPMDGDTVFFIGSVSKTFTALLLAEMVARGEVKFDDPVAMYLPATVTVPTHGGKEITLLHLATNTGGFPINPNNMVGADTREQYETYTIEKMYEYLGSFKLDRDPGAEYEYSNLGMSLLGHAMARKAGVSFETLVVERICRPLGMTSTCVVPTDEMQARLAMGRDEAGESTGPWQLDALVPAGAIHSTANDLLKYAAAQAGITKSALTPIMEQTHELRYEDHRGIAGDDPAIRFGRTGMAWMAGVENDPPGMELRGHAGGAGSYHAWVGFDKLQRRGVVVLTTADMSGQPVGRTLLERLPLSEERLHAVVQDLVGIGTALAIVPNDGLLQITKVLPDSPAADAGLSAGLIIHTVDDVVTVGKDLATCVAMIRGPAGAKVRLGLFDPEKGEARTVELTRRKFRT